MVPIPSIPFEGLLMLRYSMDSDGPRIPGPDLFLAPAAAGCGSNFLDFVLYLRISASA